MVIFCRNSLYSIISLVFLIVGSCFILFTLKVEFLTFILLLIYIGAMSVLFLFVVMMLKLDKLDKQSLLNTYRLSKDYFVYLIISIKLCCFIFYFNKKLCLSLNLFSLEFIRYNNDMENCHHFVFNSRNDNIIFLSLFSQKFLFFIIVGFTLLFSMIGSIALCLTKNK